MNSFRTLYLDTEFTEFRFPMLLSLALVGDTVEFYAEVNDFDRLECSSEFVRDNVLPQFGKVRGASVSYMQLCNRLVRFLGDLTKALGESEYLVVAYDYELDWCLLEQTMRDAEVGVAKRLSAYLIPHQINSSQPEAQQKMLEYFELQRDLEIGRHHALCDARALQKSAN